MRMLKAACRVASYISIKVAKLRSGLFPAAAATYKRARNPHG